MLLVASLSLGLVQMASAATGPAPASQHRQVLSGLHTDAVSVFAEAGALTLGTKADIGGSFGVRLDPDLTLFNIEQAAHTTVPANPEYAFLGTAGSEVWIAPEGNPGGAMLWPGFNTEGVATGQVDGNQMTIRLEAVSGPGTLHLYQADAFGSPIRRLSSTGTDYRDWTFNSSQHVHANWAFSAAGTYTLTFKVSATIGGVPVSDTQDYVFVAGDVPEAVDTITTLAANPPIAETGAPVTLTATVTPANAAGYVEFRDGATVLGHEVANAGSAVLTTSSLSLGSHAITARFEPLWTNDFSPSVSAPQNVNVTGSGGVPFQITGIASSYLPGDTLTATLSGHTLTQGQQVRWLIRRIGTTFGGSNLATAASLTYTSILDISWDGFEVAAQVRQGSTAISTTAWVPISVEPMPEVDSISTVFPAGIQYAGDILVFPLSRELEAGETARLAWLSPVGTRWSAAPTLLVGNTLQTRATWTHINFPQIEVAIQIIRNGVAVAQSDRVAGTIIDRQVQVAGIQGVYRPGQILNATAQIIPPMDGLTYRWTVTTASTETTLQEGTAPEALTLSLPTTLDMNGRLIKFYAYADDLVGTNSVLVSYWYTLLAVSDTTDQIFAFSPLSDHYHQGYPINLVLGADPQPAANDTIVWEWRWPGADWTSFPGAEGLSKSLVAEQALSGVEVRATLQFADTNATMLAGPVTIVVDDHGFPANQQPTVTGGTTVTAGDTVTLTRALPANSPTVLTTHRWERRASGAADFSVIAGKTGAALSFTAALADHGAEYRVAIMKPNGDVAYGPSPSVTLNVTAPLIATSFQTFTVSTASPRFGSSVTLTATVNPRGGTTANPLGVGGIVEFYQVTGSGDVKLGESTITSLTLSRATFSVVPPALGVNTYRARYVPPATHAPSVSSTVAVTVTPAITSVTLAASHAEVAAGQPVNIGAAVSPTWAQGQVKVLSGATIVAEGAVVDGRFMQEVTDLPPGEHQLSATFTSSMPEAQDSQSLAGISARVAVVNGAPRGSYERTVLDHEHTDVLSVMLEGGELKLRSRVDLDHASKTFLPKYGSNRERINPTDTIYHLPDKVSTGLGTPGGRKTIPNNANYAFLGEPGETVWIAPASSDLTPFIYAGFEAESIGSGVLQDNRIDIHLVSVEAPEGGKFEAYTGAFTPTGNPYRLLSSTDPAYTSAPFGTGSHDHFSWVFTKLGTYVLHVKATAILANGTPVETPVIAFKWVIGDLTGAPVIAVNENAGTEGNAQLTATVTPAAAGYVEFRDAAETLLGFAPVNAGTATLDVALTEGTHSVTADFIPAVLDQHAKATSGAAAVTVLGLPPLAAWRQTHFGTTANTGNAADDFDADSDGLENLLEFAFGLNPHQADAQNLLLTGSTLTRRGTPEVWLANIPNGVDYRATFGRLRNYLAAGLTYTVQFSADLATWHDSTSTPVVLAQDDDVEVVSVPYPLFINGKKARFFRVVVDSNEP